MSAVSSNVQAYILALTFYLITKLSDHLYMQKIGSELTRITLVNTCMGLS